MTGTFGIVGAVGAVGTVERIGVVVPVRDEERLLPRCLAALAVAVEAVTSHSPTIEVRVVLVMDGCVDSSTHVARTAPWPSVHRRPELHATRGLGVGAARRLGAASVLEQEGVRPDRTWLSSTDADSTVPRSWLLAQVEAAAAGFDAWVGTVELERAHAPGSARRRLAAHWAQEQQHHEGHQHVHGANLGVRGSSYRDAGGFAAVLTGEDELLVAALVAGGASVLRTARHPVITSDRVDGRAPGGVSADLAAMARAMPALPAVGS